MDRISFLGRRLPPSFEIRIVALAPGRERASDEAAWRDAIVAVESGEIELECPGGSRPRFVAGDLLWLSGLPLRALRNPGTEPAVLVAVSRRRAVAGGVGTGRDVSYRAGPSARPGRPPARSGAACRG